MSDPFIGEIRMFAGTYAPAGWAFCDGSVLAIAQYDTLFALIGATYGGDGQSNFALPDLRGRVPIHAGTNTVGQNAGSETAALMPGHLPPHSHTFFGAAVTADSANPVGAVCANATGVTPYTNEDPDAALSSLSVDFVGGNAFHNNMQPFLCVNFIIALEGIYPSAT